MTDPGECCDVGTDLLTDGLSDLALELSVAGFAALWHGSAREPHELVRADPAAVAEVVAALVERGRCEVDADGRLTGIHGLTLQPGQHRFTVGDRAHHTWCAYDAIGIPAAPGADADARTICPYCSQPLRIQIRGGTPDDGAAALWLPAATGEHLMNTFCATADLYCSIEHLEARIDTAKTTGEIADLVRTAALGCETWADVSVIDLGKMPDRC